MTASRSEVSTPETPRLTAKQEAGIVRDRLVEAMLDSKTGASVSASYGVRVNSEQNRRTRAMAAWLIEALPKRGLSLGLAEYLDARSSESPAELDAERLAQALHKWFCGRRAVHAPGNGYHCGQPERLAAEYQELLVAARLQPEGEPWGERSQ